MYRRAAVAGRFYPESPDQLERMVQEYVETSGVNPAPDLIAALVAPHAGYPFSGPTAGCAYARARGKKPGRVILLGNSHRYRLDHASVVQEGAFEALLGDLQIDAPFATALAERLESEGTEPHLLEHALEVHLPFVYWLFGDVPIVPVLFGGPANEWHVKAGETLAEMADPDDLVIASTDLSHYYSQTKANHLDKRSLEILLTNDIAAYTRAVAKNECLMCSSSAVVAAMAYAQAVRANATHLLDYRTSGDTGGNFDQVVGYAAVSMERAA
jgi:MEMO1 family protein